MQVPVMRLHCALKLNWALNKVGGDPFVQKNTGKVK
jgi:hypothetical protein